MHRELIPMDGIIKEVFEKSDLKRLTESFRTRKLFVGSPKTKLIASIRLDLPER